MQKFPQLSSLYLHFGPLIPAALNQHELSQMLNYWPSKLKNLSVSFAGIDDNHDIAKTFGDYWDRTSKSGKEKISVVYGLTGRGRNREEAVVNTYVSLSKTKREQALDYTFLYTESNFGQKISRFIEKNGKYVGELDFMSLGNVRISTATVVSEACMICIFEQCINLRTLEFSRSRFESLDYSKLKLCHRLSLDKLWFRHCTFPPGFFERLSLLLPKVKQMIFRFKDTLPQILMPSTKIGSISFDNTKELFLQVFVVSDLDYFHYHLSNGIFKDINDQEYDEANDLSKVYICSQTKPELQLI